MRILIGQKTIDYCAGKLKENRARGIFLYCIATHAWGQRISQLKFSVLLHSVVC